MVAQVPEVELAPRLKPCDQKEQRHRTAVDPASEVQRGGKRAKSDRELPRPEAAVTGWCDVSPDQRQSYGRYQQPGAGRFRVQERAQRTRRNPAHRHLRRLCLGGDRGVGYR